MPGALPVSPRGGDGKKAHVGAMLRVAALLHSGGAGGTSPVLRATGSSPHQGLCLPGPAPQRGVLGTTPGALTFTQPCAEKTCLDGRGREPRPSFWALDSRQTTRGRGREEARAGLCGADAYSGSPSAVSCRRLWCPLTSSLHDPSPPDLDPTSWGAWSAGGGRPAFSTESSPSLRTTPGTCSLLVLTVPTPCFSDSLFLIFFLISELDPKST